MLELELVLTISVLVPVVVVVIILSIVMFLMNVLDIARKMTVMRMILVYISRQQNICFKFVSFYLIKFSRHNCIVMYFKVILNHV